MTAPATPATRHVGETAPPRRRRSWVSRHKFASFILSLLGFVLVLRLTWGWYTARQLAAEWEKVRAQGHPTKLSDLEPAPLADAENAWTAYAQAIAAIKPGAESPRNSVIEYPQYPPHGPEWEALAEASEKANAGAFVAARQARQVARARLPRQPGKVWQPSPLLNKARGLGNTLADGAQFAHFRGDDAESIERLLDALYLARSMRQDTLGISQLVGMGIDALAVDAAQQIVPSLRLEASEGIAPATRAQAQRLIAALLDEDEAATWFVQALRTERVVNVDLLTAYYAEDVRVLRPLADRTVLRWMRDFPVLIEAGEKRNYPEAQLVLQSLPPPADRSGAISGLFGAQPKARTVPRYSRWFDQFGPEDLARSIETYHRCSVERRVTAFMVAARLYRHDHSRWPDDAASLVPAYLDALPPDPFRRDGGPLGYVLQRGVLSDGGDRPLVRFEGGDTDQGAIDSEPMYGWQRDRRPVPQAEQRRLRQYRDVSLWMPTSRRFDEYQKRSGAQSVDEDPDEPDAPGNDSDDDRAADSPAEQ